MKPGASITFNHPKTHQPATGTLLKVFRCRNGFVAAQVRTAERILTIAVTAIRAAA